MVKLVEEFLGSTMNLVSNMQNHKPNVKEEEKPYTKMFAQGLIFKLVLHSMQREQIFAHLAICIISEIFHIYFLSVCATVWTNKNLPRNCSKCNTPIYYQVKNDAVTDIIII